MEVNDFEILSIDIPFYLQHAQNWYLMLLIKNEKTRI